MTGTSDEQPAPTVSPSSARVSFRQPVSPSGHLDGAWWPRSTDLTAELPALLEMVWTAARDITRVTFHLGAWAPAPRKLRVEGRVVRLGGFATGDALTVRLTDSWARERIDLLVIAPDTDPAMAERALLLASRTDSADTAGDVLAHAARDVSDGPAGRGGR